MKAASSLAFLATVVTVLAGPVKHVNFHAVHLQVRDLHTSAETTTKCPNDLSHPTSAPLIIAALTATASEDEASSNKNVAVPGVKAANADHKATTTTTKKKSTATSKRKTTTTTKKTSTGIVAPVKHVDTVQPPAQTGAGTVGGCMKWYVAKKGDYCSLIASENSIALQKFMSWNPSVGSNCLTLYAGYAYCVSVPAVVQTARTTTAVPKKAAPLTTTAKTTIRTTTKTTTKPTTKSTITTTKTTTKTTATTTTTTTTKKTTTSSTVSAVGVPAPTTTGAGTVNPCTKWYVAASGDYCSLIASNNGISTSQFITWNPSVGSNCASLYAGWAYCVATTAVAGSGPSSTTSPAASQPSNTSPVQSGGYTYQTFTGDGTMAQGWPSQSQWLTFEQMWDFNVPIMQQSCAQWNVPNDSADEIAYMKTAIQQVSASSGVDPRFILAIIMQESNGCVRVITTQWSFPNPGLMQTNQGTGSCNRNGVVQTPCPNSEILQMIEDGTTGTATGDGLKQCLAETGVTDVSMYYKAARIYNGGLNGWVRTNLNAGCCTLCYSSDVANRLLGWHTGPSDCNLGTA